MEVNEVHEVKHEDDTSASTPSFKGRLDLTDFGFSVTLDAGHSEVRRSLRNSPLLESQGASSSSKRNSSHLSPSPSAKNKKLRSPQGYAPPTTYAHLPELRDVLVPNLICVFIGLNPGLTTASSGHAYAHPSNLFWKLLHSSGCTTRRCSPQEDSDLPRLFELGNTNIVARPTRNGSELSKAEMDDNVQLLEEKIMKFKPESVCIVGKGIWESIWRVKHSSKMKKGEFKYGWQDEGENIGTVTKEAKKWGGAKVFVATTTSGLAASMGLEEKERVWRELGIWVEQRRSERTAARSLE